MSSARRLLIAALAACTAAQAGTVVEYRRDGDCATDFDRMAIDGLRARIDLTIDGSALSTIADDGEQLTTQLLHELRRYMTMESDDDAIDFQSDVMRAGHIHAGRQAEALTGLDAEAATAAFRAQQIAACPEMAELGFADPDYAEAAARCAESMAAAANAPRGEGDRHRAIDAAIGSGQARAAPAQPAAPAAAAPWRTTTVERGDEIEIDGRRCRIERLVRGERVLREDCTSAIADLGLEPAALRRLNRIAAVGATVGRGVAELHPEAAGEDGPPRIALSRRCFRDDRHTGTATLTIRSGVAVPADRFEIPGDYRPMTLGAQDSEDAPFADEPD
ncbi:MAG TPA: hypothetical protein VMR06_00320 [Dokdonella sp.]|uniref:hypothetical protein n=1 Tax=Dokdonella sp. TaxID=2291710 RepID=UPI002C05F142|nr:hypothetical protein [Dokdonella sp.]HUD40424.1 hypothetical protein [Dokdonella sp.]